MKEKAARNKQKKKDKPMISPDTVQLTRRRIAALQPEEVQPLINRMAKNQPVILAYLLAASQAKPLRREEGETFFYIGVVVWEIMKQGTTVPRKVTEKQLWQAEKVNENILDKMASDSAGDFASATVSLVEQYPEPEVLRYIVEALIEGEDGENPPIRDENLGLAFLHLKIVLDALIANAR